MRVYIVRMAKQQQTNCAAVAIAASAAASAQEALCQHLKTLNALSEFSLFVCCFLFLMDRTMFTLIVGDICERFYNIIPVVVLVMHYGPVTLLKFPDSVSIVLQTLRSFLKLCLN